MNKAELTLPGRWRMHSLTLEEEILLNKWNDSGNETKGEILVTMRATRFTDQDPGIDASNLVMMVALGPAPVPIKMEQDD